MARQRSIITPEHFVVAPEVLGLPLASPMRRAWAMAIDGLLVVILVKAGGVALGIVAALLLFRAAAPDPRSGFVKRYVRAMLRLGGAAILFVVVLKGFDRVRDRVEEKPQPANVPAAADSATNVNVNLHLSPRQLAALPWPVLKLRRAEDSAQVAQATAELLEAARNSGASESDLRETRSGFIELLGDKADASRVGAVDAALKRVVGETPPPPSPDSVVRRYLAAVDDKDSAAAGVLRDSIKKLVAGAEIAGLNKRADRLKAQNDSLQDAVAKAEKPHGIHAFLSDAADDLGVGFGWSAVYFTAFFALWRGQTPGKKIAGVRVIRLDGEPLGWWMSFERFGGYAASFSVGLLGFLQILWDRNRQGLHDKACETVVVRLTPTASSPADARTAAPAQAAPYRPR